MILIFCKEFGVFKCVVIFASARAFGKVCIIYQKRGRREQKILIVKSEGFKLFGGWEWGRELLSRFFFLFFLGIDQ